MNKYILRFLCLICFVSCGLLVKAQSQIATSGSVNDTMRSHDKIYVVMAVCLTILVGLILYIMRIDRKIGLIEKES